jgi:hypothetical protein|tara:strand:- start:386 stop:775 length:390 start_codon:yes stop_codon:yes gene_type:complete
MLKPVKKVAVQVEAQDQSNLVEAPQFFLHGETFEVTHGILSIDRKLSSMFSKITVESLSRLQKTITFGESFVNKKGTANVVAYKTAPDGTSFKLGYVSKPSEGLAAAMLTGGVVFHEKKIVSEAMMSDF